MSEIEVKIRDDKAMLYTPYNPEFVKSIKKFSDARWNSGEKCWTIDESNLDAARVIMKEIYGYADNEINEKVTLKIHVKESVSKKHGDVILFGKILRSAGLFDKEIVPHEEYLEVNDNNQKMRTIVKLHDKYFEIRWTQYTHKDSEFPNDPVEVRKKPKIIDDWIPVEK